MLEAGIAAKARFDIIRYAQVWEDADVLVAAPRSTTTAAAFTKCWTQPGSVWRATAGARRRGACVLA
jgi:hypothetical protein